MKWIGQHIWDYVTRLRNDVYLESIESGTIASGGNLGLDSNNKIVKAAEVGSSVDLTSEVTGVLPVANGGSGASSLTDNSVLTGTGTSAITAESGFTWNDFDLDLSSTGEGKPLFTLESRHTTRSESAELKFLKDAANVEDGEVLGKICFYGDNDAGTPEEIKYAEIFGMANDVTDGTEEGGLYLKVASHDGEMQTGVSILSGDAEDEIDVVISNGTSSLTTIAGDLTVTSKAIIPTRKYELPSSTVGDYSGGDIYYYGDGSTVKGKIYYIDGTNWTLADADTEAATKGLLAVALGTDPDVDGMLLRGFVTLLTEVEGTEAIGSPLYLSATDSGIATVTAPGSGDFVRVLGYSLHATNNQVYFNPDNTWVERA